MKQRNKKQATGQRDIVALFNRQFGSGIVISGENLEKSVPRIPTGILPVDYLTRGGIPAGRITLLRGKEGGTKTSLALVFCKRYLELCKGKEKVFYVDSEGKFPAEFLRALDIPRRRLLIARPETIEQTLDVVQAALRNEEIGFFVLDSIAALVPRVEIDKNAEEKQQGIVAREINKMMRRIMGAMLWRKQRNNCPTVILINQERVKIGIIYGDPTTIPGGEMQKYASALTLRLWTRKRKEEQDPVEDPNLVRVVFSIVKHSFGPSGKSGEYLFSLEKRGSLAAGEARDEDFLRGIARGLGLVKPNGGGWEVYDGSKLASLEDLSNILRQRHGLYQDLKAKVGAAILEATRQSD